MKTNGGGGLDPPILFLALDAGEWSILRPRRFTPGEIIPVPIGLADG
jgi:hypothetical protein